MELKIALSTRLWVSSTSWNYIKHLVPATSNTSNNKALSPWSSSLPGVASTRRVTEKMGQCLVMTYELVCNEVLRKFQEYHRDKSGVHGTRSSHQDPFRSQDGSRVSKPGHLGGHRTNSIYEAMKAENHRMTEE